MTEDEKVVSFFGRRQIKGAEEKTHLDKHNARQKALRVLGPAIRQLRQLGLSSAEISTLLRFSADGVGGATDDAGKPFASILFWLRLVIKNPGEIEFTRAPRGVAFERLAFLPANYPLDRELARPVAYDKRTQNACITFVT
jgi:hypothetical protein